MNFLKNKILLSGFLALFSLMVSAQTANYVNGGLNVDVFVSNACDGLDNGYFEFNLNSASGGTATLLLVDGPIGFTIVGQPLTVGIPFIFDNGGAGLPTGTFDFIIDDGGGININTYSSYPSPVINAYNAIAISVDTKTDNTSCITPDGAITVSLTNGSGSYTYGWTGPAGYSSNGVNTTGTPISIAGLEGGTYTLTVDDDFSVCSATVDVVLTSPTVTIVSDAVTPNDRCIAPYSGAISITASGAGGTYSYSWSGPNGYTSSNEDITNLEAGNYTVSVTDLTSGCVNSLLIPVTLNTPIIGVTLDSDVGNSSCTSPNGSLTITPTGGTTYSYLWTGPNGFTSAVEDISGLEQGNYTVTVTDDVSGCFFTSNFVVADIRPVITVAVDSNIGNTSCTVPNGQIAVTSSGGTGYTYAWSGPAGFTSTVEDITGLIDGNYSLVVTDVASGCESIPTVVAVADNTPVIGLTLDSNTGNSNCVGPNGALSVTPSGGTTYSYVWSGPAAYSNTTEDITGLEAGDYSILVTDDVSGCTFTTTYTVADNRPVIAVATSVVTGNSSCITPNGAIAITVSGGTTYTFSWTGPAGFTSAAQDITALGAGDYTIVATDITTGCTDTQIINVPDITPVVAVTLDSNTPNTSCVAFNGALSITPSGGTSYSYSWIGPNGFTSTLEDITALEPGTYDLTVTEITSGCTNTASYIVLQSVPTLSVALDANTPNTSCVAFNGSLEITPAGGTGYTYSWTGPNGFTSTNEDIFTLEAGAYNVTVTDVVSGCTVTDLYNLVDAIPTISVVVDGTTDYTSCALPDGAINITASGGTGYTYAWSEPGGFTSTAEDLTGLLPGNYTVIVTDVVTGCTATIGATINDLSPVLSVVVDATTDNTNCATPYNGTASVTVSGGGPAYTFEWLFGAVVASTVEDPVDLRDGTYTLNVTDNTSGCVVTTTVTVGNSIVLPVVSLDNMVQNTKCVAPFTGELQVTISAGSGAYSYAWTGPSGFTATTEDIAALRNGIYNLTVTDTNTGCTGTFSTTVTNNTPILGLSTDLLTHNTSCTVPNGEIQVTVSGGVSYTYSWTDGAGFTATTEDISGLVNGTYTLTVTEDLSGCSISKAYTVNDNTSALTITTDLLQNTTSCLALNGEIQVTLAGGTSYDYSWTGPNGFTSTVEDIAGLEAGTYVLTVSDLITSCSATQSFDVLEILPALNITVDATTDNTDCATPNGAVAVTVTGSTDLTFAWSSVAGYSAATEDISGLIGDDYTLLVTDNPSGCTATVTVNVAELASPIVVTGIVTENTTCVPANGAIALTVTGAVGGETYSWTGPGGFTASTADITGLIGGSYSVTVSESGCNTVQTFNVVDNLPVISISVVGTTDNTDCSIPNGAIDVLVAGATTPVFAWTGPLGFTASTEDITGIVGGDYTITVTDTDNGCSTSLLVTIAELASPIVVSGTITDDTSCLIDNGAIALTVTGATGGETYSWTGPGGFTSSVADLVDLATGTYTVSISESGCTTVASFDVQETLPALAIVVDNVVDNTDCATPNGAINVTVSGSTDLTLTWTGAGGFAASALEDITGLIGDSYTLLVTDNPSGCTASVVVAVAELASPISATAIVTDNTSCLGFNGEIILTTTGTAGAETYSWTGPNGFTASTKDISGLEPGDYTVTIFESGCTTILTFTVNDVPAVITILENLVTPNTDCIVFNGAIDIAVFNAASPTFDWVGPNGFTSTSEDLTALEAGDYTVIVTDATSGCTGTLTVNVPDNSSPFTVTGTPVDNTACTIPNGSITLSVTGTAGGETYSWTGPGGFTSNLKDLTDLSAGIYEVTVFENGCSDISNYEIFDVPGTLSIVIDAQTDNTDCTVPTGSVSITVTGGGANLSYAWSGLGGFTSTVEDITGLIGDTYTVVVTDNDTGCTATISATIAELASPIIVTSVATDNTSCSVGNGTITLTVTGAAGAETYSWVGPGGFTASTADLTALSPGDYTVSVSEAGCTTIHTVTVIDNPVVLTVVEDATTSNTVCIAPFDGTASITVSGGDGNYTYSWTGPNGYTSIVEDPSDLPSGNLTVLATDGNGCTGTLNVLIADATPTPTVSYVTVDNTSCTSPYDGSINITVTGGSGDFSFNWVGPNGFVSTAEDITAIAKGGYTVTVTDNISGCTSLQSITVNGPTPAQCGITCSGWSFSFANTLPTCGSDNGVIVLSSLTLNGVPVTNYQVTLQRAGDLVPTVVPNPINATITGLQAGDYQYSLFDFVSGTTCNGTVPLPFQTAVQATARDFVDSPCFGEAQGSAIIDATGSSTGDYYYSVDNGLNWTLFTPGNVINVLPPNGTYNVYVAEDPADACPTLVEVTINNAGAEIFVDYTTSPASCANNDGSITVLGATGGAGGFTFIFDGVPFSNLPPNGVFTNLSGGDHELVAVDASGCKNTLTVSVPFPGLVDFDLAAIDPDCSTNTGDNGSIIVGLNEVGTFSLGISTSQTVAPTEVFSVNSNGSSSFTFPNLGQGTYFVFATSSGAACPDVKSTSILGGPTAITFDANVQCSGNSQEIVLTNITGQKNKPITIDIYRIGTNTAVATLSEPKIPVGNTFTISDQAFLSDAFEYAVQITQAQDACPGVIIESEINTVQISAPLFAEAVSQTDSYPDKPNGKLTIANFDGMAPFMIQIELLAPDVVGQNFQTNWENVPQNSNLDYEMDYDALPAGRYLVEVNDDIGCEYAFDVTIELNKDLFIPNIFTPNNDGVNDVFYIRNNPLSGVELVISNRWGNRVYKSENYQNDWDAENVEDGVYFYFLKIGEEVKKGWVEIQRGVKPGN